MINMRLTTIWIIFAWLTITTPPLTTPAMTPAFIRVSDELSWSVPSFFLELGSYAIPLPILYLETCYSLLVLFLPVLFFTTPLVDEFPANQAIFAVYWVIHDQLEVLRIFTSSNPLSSPPRPNATSKTSSTK